MSRLTQILYFNERDWLKTLNDRVLTNITAPVKVTFLVLIAHQGRARQNTVKKFLVMFEITALVAQLYYKSLVDCLLWAKASLVLESIFPVH